MSIIEEFIGTFFQEVLWVSVRRLGSFVRWVFLRKKYSYKDIYEQDWNGRIGLLTIIITVLILIGLKSKFYNPRNRLDKAKTEVKKLTDNDEIKNGDFLVVASR